jgi:serine/threonine protein kinase
VDGIRGLLAAKLVMGQNGPSGVDQELEVMRSIPRHDAIVGLIGASRVPGSANSRLLIMELMDISLGNLLRQRRSLVEDGIEEWFSGPEILSVIRGVILGVLHLHRCRVQHRDIKVSFAEICFVCHC